MEYYLAGWLATTAVYYLKVEPKIIKEGRYLAKHTKNIAMWEFYSIFNLPRHILNIIILGINWWWVSIPMFVFTDEFVKEFINRIKL